MKYLRPVNIRRRRFKTISNDLESIYIFLVIRVRTCIRKKNSGLGGEGLRGQNRPYLTTITSEVTVLEHGS